MARTRILVVKDLAVSAMADAAHAARAGYDMLIAVKAMPPKIRPCACIPRLNAGPKPAFRPDPAVPSPFPRLARAIPMDRLLPGVLAVVGLFEQTLGARDATLPLIRLGPALVLMGLMLCAPGEMASFAMMALAVDMLVMVIHGHATPMAMVLHGLCMVGMALATAWGLRRRMGPLRNRTVTLRNLLDLTTGGAVMALPLALADAALTHGRHGVPTANLLFGHIGPIMLGVVTLLPLVLMRRRKEGTTNATRQLRCARCYTRSPPCWYRPALSGPRRFWPF
jgi:hypothetical protein